MCDTCGGKGFEIAPEQVEQLDQNVRVSAHNWGQLVEAAKIMAGQTSFEMAVAKTATRFKFLLAEEALDMDAFFYAVSHAACTEAGLGAKVSELPPLVTTDQRV